MVAAAPQARTGKASRLLRFAAMRGLTSLVRRAIDAGIDVNARDEAGRTAAMLDVPFGTCVLIDLPSGHRLVQVWDRGSRRNLARARRKGAQTWVDIYVNTASRRVLNQSWVRPVWVTTTGVALQ